MKLTFDDNSESVKQALIAGYIEKILKKYSLEQYAIDFAGNQVIIQARAKEDVPAIPFFVFRYASMDSRMVGFHVKREAFGDFYTYWSNQFK